MKQSNRTSYLRYLPFIGNSQVQFALGLVLSFAFYGEGAASCIIILLFTRKATKRLPQMKLSQSLTVQQVLLFLHYSFSNKEIAVILAVMGPFKFSSLTCFIIMQNHCNSDVVNNSDVFTTSDQA